MELRRTLLVLAGAASVTAILSLPAMAADPIKMGLLEDVSGDLALMGMPKLHGAQLAVDELLADGFRDGVCQARRGAGAGIMAGMHGCPRKGFPGRIVQRSAPGFAMIRNAHGLEQRSW